MSKLLSSILLFLPLLVSCNHHYKIEGISTVTGLNGRTISIKSYENNQWVTIDSTEVLHGLFHLEGTFDSTKMVTLEMNGNNIMPLIIEGGAIKVNITNNDLLVSGTPLNEKLYSFIEENNKFGYQLNAIKREEAHLIMDGRHIDDIAHIYKMKKDSILSEHQEYVQSTIEDNYHNIVGSSIFFIHYSQMHYPLITPEIEKILEKAPESFTENKFVKLFISRAQENKRAINHQ